MYKTMLQRQYFHKRFKPISKQCSRSVNFTEGIHRIQKTANNRRNSKIYFPCNKIIVITRLLKF